MSIRGKVFHYNFESLNAFMTKVEKLREEGLTDSVIGVRLGVARTTIVDRRRAWLRLRAERVAAAKDAAVVEKAAQEAQEAAADIREALAYAKL